MKRAVIFSVFLFFVFNLTGCKPGVSPLLLDNFEGEINSETVDFGASDNSQIKVTASQENKFCGRQSLKISYDLKSGGYMWAGRGYGLEVEGAGSWLVEPRDIEWDKYGAISIAMYGQNNGAMYAFDIKDSGGEIWRYIIDDDFEGWEQLFFPFEHFFSRQDWQPEEAEVNQVLDFPVKSYQFEPILPGERKTYFDCVKLTSE